MSRKHLRLGAVTTAVIAALFVGMGTAQADDPTTGGDKTGKVDASTAELVYRPVTPCRIVDTRHGGGGKISNNDVRTYSAVSGLLAQGASLASCGVPSGATGITGNVTITQTTGFGNLRVFPANASEPNASTINWTGSNQTFANEVNIGLSSNQFKVSGDIGGGGDTHVIVDVTGFFVQQLEVVALGNGSIFSSTNRVTSVARLGTGEYKVTFNGVLASVGNDCAAIATPRTTAAQIATINQSGSSVDVHLKTNAGAAVDGVFTLHVLC